MKIAVIVVLILVAAAFALWTPDRDRASLEARYARGPADFVDVAGVRVHVRDTGPRNAPAVVMLHGFGASLHTWDAWAAALDAGFRVIRFDLPGAGLSGTDPGDDYSDARAMDVLEALMAKLDIPRATLIGHSMGGRLAWRFAAANPSLVARLVLVAPDGFASTGYSYGTVPEVPLSMKLMPYVMPKFMLRMGLQPAYADPAVLTDALVDRYFDLMLAPGVRHAMVRKMAQSVLPDPQPLLGQIKAPVLLLWGEADAMIPVANAADYMSVLPKTTLVELPGIGHLLQEEGASAGLGPLRNFLASK